MTEERDIAMAMVQCIECGHMVSDKAGFCPACGNPDYKAPASPSRQIPIVVMSMLPARIWLMNSAGSVLPLNGDGHGFIETRQQYTMICRCEAERTISDETSGESRTESYEAERTVSFSVPPEASLLTVAVHGDNRTGRNGDGTCVTREILLVGDIMIHYSEP